jgi:hypothetical protein
MPFAQAARLLLNFTHTQVSDSTAQRHTEAVGVAYEAVQLAEVERIERDWPDVEPGPAKLVVSADGAMVPLLGGEWAEVKTVVVSEVGERMVVDGKAMVPTHTPSYFSRLSDAETFGRLSLGELTRRRLERAEQVAGVNDGAEWIQGFLDYHCPEALRILDFAHAAERICQIEMWCSERGRLRARAGGRSSCISSSTTEPPICCPSCAPLPPITSRCRQWMRTWPIWRSA